MYAKYILAAVAIIFLSMGSARIIRDAAQPHPQGKIWLLVGAIFAVVSVYLIYQG